MKLAKLQTQVRSDVKADMGSMKITIQFDEPYVKTYTSKVQKAIENIDQLGVW